MAQIDLRAAAEAGRALIAECLIEGGPGDPETLETAATLCNAAPVLVAALRDAIEYAERGTIRGRAVLSQGAIDHFSRALALATDTPTAGTGTATPTSESAGATGGIDLGCMTLEQRGGSIIITGTDGPSPVRIARSPEWVVAAIEAANEREG